MAHPTLCLALAKSAFKATDENDAVIHEFKAKPRQSKQSTNYASSLSTNSPQVISKTNPLQSQWNWELQTMLSIKVRTKRR